MLAATLALAALRSSKVLPLIVVASSASLKTALTVENTLTPVAPAAGVVDETLGPAVSTP